MNVVNITEFNFKPDTILNRKYKIVSSLGKGWEGEVYLVEEVNSSIIRAAKFFYPERNIKNKALRYYAEKLYRLRTCPIVIQYHAQEVMRFKKTEINFMVSEYVKGEILTEYINKHPGRRMNTFAALHLLYALSKGMECIHNLKEYHGDLHTDNIIMVKTGLEMELKVIDFFRREIPRKTMIQGDICDIIKIFYDALGGARRYSQHSSEIKSICRGMKYSLILKNFPTAGRLRSYLENLQLKSIINR